MPALRRIESPPPPMGREAIEPVHLPLNLNVGLVSGLALAIGGVLAILAYYGLL